MTVLQRLPPSCTITCTSQPRRTHPGFLSAIVICSDGELRPAKTLKEHKSVVTQFTPVKTDKNGHRILTPGFLTGRRPVNPTIQ